MLRVRVEDVVLPIHTALVLLDRKFRMQSHRAVLSHGSLSMVTSLEGTIVLNAEPHQ